MNNTFSGGVISLANDYTFDYETTSSFYLTISVKDEYLPGILSQVLTINVNDMNEEPSLRLRTTQLTTQEGNVRLSSVQSVTVFIFAISVSKTLL